MCLTKDLLFVAIFITIFNTLCNAPRVLGSLILSGSGLKVMTLSGRRTNPGAAHMFGKRIAIHVIHNTHAHTFGERI